MIDPGKTYDLIGVGLGPSNLSTSALLTKTPDFKSLFLEKQATLRWHPNMMYDFSSINVGFQKDLVTLVDPTNPYSFLNYLVETGKQYMFFNSVFSRVPRLEFESYYRWSAEKMTNVRLSSAVQSLEYAPEEDLFKVHLQDETLYAKHIVSGTGIRPRIPEWAGALDPSRVFHCYNIANAHRETHNKKIMIVGGGQSGAEALFSLLGNEETLPAEIVWVSSKGYPVSLDENPFANDLYTPSFSNSFFELDSQQREKYNHMLRDTSDGISANLLEKIYQRLFFLTEVKKHSLRMSFVPVSKVTKVDEDTASQTYSARAEGFSNFNIPDLDQIILCTGFIQNDLPLLQGLDNYCDTEITVREDFSIKPNCDTSCRVYIHNGARSFFGPADPNLSLISWRSAKIINAIMQEEIYNLNHDYSMVNWHFTTPSEMTSNLPA